MSSKHEYVLSGGSIIRRTITEAPINADTAIERAFGAARVTLWKLGVGQMGGVIHAHYDGGALIVAQNIPHLNLRTWFAPSSTPEGDVLVPVFRSVGECAVELQAQWFAPAGNHLWFVTNHHPGLDYTKCYLVMTSDDGRNIRRLPLNNIYNDGRICMGEDAKQLGIQARNNCRGNDLSTHAVLIDAFMKTSWNTDLDSYVSRVPAVFRFDFHGKQLPPVGGWRDNCDAVSSLIYNWLGGAPTFPFTPPPEADSDDADEDETI